MKSLMYLMILKLGVLITPSATSSVNDHINLIADVFNVYKPSSLTFLHFAGYHNWTQMNLISNIQLLLVRKYIKTLAVNLEEIFSVNSTDLCNTKHIKNDAKPMSVFFLNSKKNIQKIKILPKCYLSKLINLIVFAKTDDRPLIEFCMKSVGNPLNLQSDVLFLVKCYDDSAIRKWQSLSSKQMRVFEWATWKPETGLVLKPENVTFKEINQLNGQVLFIGTVQDHEILTLYTDRILHALQLAANFTTVNIETPKIYGSWNEDSKTWSGGYGLIVNGKVDLIASLYLMTPNRVSNIDYTIPIKELEMCLYIRKIPSQTIISWTAYFKPFSPEVWIAMVLLFIAIHTILTLVKTKMQKWFGHGRFVLENYLHIWGCYCQQAVPEFPSASSLRLVYCSTFFFAFCIISIYSACFVSFIAVIPEDVHFKSLEGFLKDGSYKLAVLQDTENYDFFQDATQSPWIEMNQLLINRNELPLTIEDASYMICNDKVALWTDDLDLSLIENTLRSCPIVKVKTGTYVHTSMILRKGSPYTKAINYHISRLKQDGILKYFDSTLDLQKFDLQSKSENKFESVTIWQIVPLLSIIVGGICLAVMVLCIEIWFDNLENVNTSIFSIPSILRIRRNIMRRRTT